MHTRRLIAQRRKQSVPVTVCCGRVGDIIFYLTLFDPHPRRHFFDFRESERETERGTERGRERETLK